jgi:hypothetical protein
MSPAIVPSALRRRIYERAHGQCEYCLIPEVVALVPHEVDHIIAQKHAGPTQADNLALACSLCNQRKGTDLASIDPASGALTPLCNPRRDRWREHFELHEALLIGRTAVGRVTVRLLQLNLPARVTERELLLRSGTLRIPE